jgi:hypothetical protein
MSKPDIRARFSREVHIDADSFFWQQLSASELDDPLALMLHLEHEAEIYGGTLHEALALWYGPRGCASSIR